MSGADPGPDAGAMTTLHVENTVNDYEAWKETFDKFDRARRDRGMRSYRLTRDHEDPQKVIVDMEFDSTTRAEEFREFLRGVIATPQAQGHLVEHRPIVILDVMEERQLS
jgi:hypothetical protein